MKEIILKKAKKKKKQKLFNRSNICSTKMEIIVE